MKRTKTAIKSWMVEFSKVGTCHIEYINGTKEQVLAYSKKEEEAYRTIAAKPTREFIPVNLEWNEKIVDLTRNV